MICPRCKTKSVAQETACLACGEAFEPALAASSTAPQSAALALEAPPPKTEAPESDLAESRLSKWAIASVGLGVLAWLLLFYENPIYMRLVYALGGERTLFAVTALLALGGIVAGHKALFDLSATPGLYEGRGLAIFGLLINYLFLFFSALVIYINISMNAL